MGPICKPSQHDGATDAFSFGATDAHVQGMRNLMVLATLPWAAMWALGAEMTQAGRATRRE